MQAGEEPAKFGIAVYGKGIKCSHVISLTLDRDKRCSFGKRRGGGTGFRIQVAKGGREREGVRGFG